MVRLTVISYFVRKFSDHEALVFSSLKQAIDAGFPRVQDYPEFCKKPGSVGSSTVEKLKGRFEIGSQYHFSLEPQSCICIPIEDGMDVYSSTQWMDATQIVIAEALNVPNNLINMNVRRLGGGFGGKISRAAFIACAAAVAAHLLNRPVRMILSIEANMETIGKRYPCISDYEVEVDVNGKIQKLLNEYYEDYGSSFNEPAYLTTGFFSNCYESDSFEVHPHKVKTDTASNTWCRGPGTVEGIAMIENIMEHIARKVKKDPLEVRLNNISSGSELKNHLMEFSKSVGKYNFKSTNAFITSWLILAYSERKKVIDQFNLANRWMKKGIAIVPMKFHVEYFGSLHALVSVYHRDGSVSVTVGGIEMGQGLNTKVAQTVAHVLGIPLDQVSIKPSSSLTAPNAIVTGGSIGSEISCFVSLINVI